ncbi:MAG TPA: hypothetical protein DCR97_09230 [Deltaproteobacteria bacterium]|nr:hypothetical protein [Deltaproteobacteria bacterium]
MTTKSGSLSKAGIYLLSLVVFLLGACAKPPVREMSEAQRNLDQARAKGADVYAPDLYLKAEGSFREAKNLVAERSYEKARKLAESASKLALQASVMAETNKASLKEETERIITEAEQGINDIRAWAPPGSMKRRLDKLLARRKAELEAWKANLDQIRTELSEEKMGDAKLGAEKVLAEVDTFIRTLQAASSARPAKRRR